MKGSKKTLCIIVAIVVLAGAAGAWLWHSSETANQNQTIKSPGRANAGGRGMSGAPSPVQVASAVHQAVPHYLTGLGTVTAANTARVRSRVDGQLMAIHFQEGQQVQAGDLLAELDPSQFKVALAQAEGQLARDQATLANAKRDLARYQQLAKSQVISRQEMDTQQALVAESEGTVRTDRAALANAELQLNWSKITAPIAGRVGLRQVDIGNQVSSGDTEGIVVITQTQPIDALFTLPESDIANIISAQSSQQNIEIEAWDRANRNLIAKGTLLSLDNLIDTTTGTLKAKARFTNQDNSLFPNQFVNIKLLLNTQQDAIVIPTSALQMGSEGHFVWVVDDKQQVTKKNVEPGLQNAETVVIDSGLPIGTRVVTDGVDRLKEGDKIEVIDAFDHQAARSGTKTSQRGPSGQ